MEEIEYKLRKNNAVLIVNAISKLVDTIVNKGPPQSGNIEQLPELKFLKKQCEDSDPIISITACQGIVTLVERGVLGVIPTLSGFIASLHGVRNYSGIISSIGILLTIDLKARFKEHGSYECPFNLISPKHPLITVLKQNKDTWFDVLNVMQSIVNNNEEIVALNSFELLRPVFLYVLCDPTTLKHLPITCQQEAWKLLLNSCFLFGKKDLLIEVLSWLQIRTEPEILHCSQMFIELADLALQKEDTPLSSALSPFMASLIHRLISYGHDPRSCLSVLSRLLAVNPESGSCILMIFAKTISSCPAVFLKDLVTFCVSITKMKMCNAIAATMVKCALLQWLVYPSYLTGEALELASSILARLDDDSSWPSYTSKLYANKLFNHLRNTDALVASSAEMCRLAETWQINPRNIENWLQRLSEVPKNMNDQLELFIPALFIHGFEQNTVKHESFKLLLKLVEANNAFAATAITYILYKLAEEKEPFLQLEFLRGLTKMAIQKENINLILHTLESMKTKQNMKPMLVDLYVRLWKVENRCYPYLQKLLIESPIDDKDSKFDMARAFAIKEICETSPNQHGPELVKLLSQILNQCGSTEGALSSALALQGITALCKVEIVNIATTWRALSPKLSRDKRPVVIKSLCDFFGCVLSMNYTSQEYDKLLTEVITKLWSYVSTSQDPEIVSAAFNALSKAELEKLSLKTLPECYRQRLVLPSSYTKTPVDAARRPEDVLPYIPCECWIQLLQNTKPESLDAAGDTLVTWLSTELLMYQIGIYRTATARGEPANYSKLHPRSICRGLTDYLFRISQGSLEPSEIPVVRQCLRILGHTFPKPLPPLTWTFLKEFIEKPELQEFCLLIAILQAVASPSARRIIEDFLNTFEPSVENEKTVRKLFENLSDLCNGVPPNVLKPFIDKSFGLAIDISGQEDEGNELILKEIFSHVKATLKRDDIHESNKTMLSLVIEGLQEKLSANNKVFDAYVDCVAELTSKYLERMSSPSVLWTITPDKLRQSIGIRSAVACRADTEVPLVWLNECIDATLDLVGEHTSMLQSIAQVLNTIRRHETNFQWTKELLWRIQNVIKEKQDSDKQQAIVFLCDVFLITVIILSGYDCLIPSLDFISSSRENRLQLFPQALVVLLIEEKWNNYASQLMEWLHHMQHNDDVSSLYADTFHRGLTALRHHKYMRTLPVWAKFIFGRCVKLQ